MAALRKLLQSDDLYVETHICQGVQGIRADLVYRFLSERGFTSLREVTTETLTSFISYIRREYAFSPTKYSAYKGDLETLVFNLMKKYSDPLAGTSYADSPMGRKCITFLYASGIGSISGITAETRRSYEEYLLLSVPAKFTEYLKVIDKMVISEIEKATIKRPLLFRNKLLYLGYHPDIDIARRLYYTARKEFLYFDFSLPAPITLKKQIFLLLTEDISRMEKISNHYFLQHFITPLYYLYDFCLKNGIEDIKQIDREQISSFKEYLNRFASSLAKDAPQVLFRAKKILFLTDEKTDYTATAWYLGRFNLTDRKNPTRGVEAFVFDDISTSDRVYFQHYMKYLLVLSPKYSLQSLLEKYYAAKEFIKFIESRNNDLTELSYADIEDFIEKKHAQGIKPFSYNKTLTMLSFFLTVMSVREKLLIPSFPFEYFYKKASYLHHDRSVPDSDIDKIFSVLPDFPETIGLMYLTLYSTGLRINEVCSIRKDSLSFEDDICWLKTYQYKMNSEKMIPIPEEISRLLKRHIREELTGSEYVFPSCRDKDKPYQAATFVKQMKAQLLMYDQTKALTFRSHDYRHTIATDIHMSGAKIAATRAFLGHRSEDMTMQYIDHLPGHIDVLQDKYFKEDDLYETDV